MKQEADELLVKNTSILEDHAGSIELLDEKQNTTFKVVLPKFKMKLGG